MGNFKKEANSDKSKRLNRRKRKVRFVFRRINAQKRSEVPKQRLKINYYLKVGKLKLEVKCLN